MKGQPEVFNHWLATLLPMEDGSTSWENLADIKESHPIETAKYAKILGIDHEPAFN
jgi:hypothetical protein